VEEGRVIIDRDRRWSALYERLEDLRAEAAVEDERMATLAREAIA
jgi:hypothetical protein